MDRFKQIGSNPFSFMERHHLVGDKGQWRQGEFWAGHKWASQMNILKLILTVQEERPLGPLPYFIYREYEGRMRMLQLCTLVAREHCCALVT